MAILLTGGAGYIGSHTLLLLLESGYDVVVLDNLSNASAESIARVQKLAQRKAVLVEADVRDEARVADTLTRYRIDAVVHFAGLKSVGESSAKPLDYYDNNVFGTVCLCRAMASAGVKTLIFSSSATVYGETGTMPLRESAPTGQPTNPYGQTKLVVEKLLDDLSRSDPDWAIGVLRYFNPVGAHESGDIGEDPTGIPNNLLPYITQVAVGRLDQLSVFGGDYPTADGTGVRDYIHVMDLAAGHLLALDAVRKTTGGLDVWNLGTGRGYSVLEMIAAFERASRQKINYQVVPRRAGDIAECWADASKAEAELGWRATRGIEEVMRDAWRWQQGNPEGY